MVRGAMCRKRHYLFGYSDDSSMVGGQHMDQIEELETLSKRTITCQANQ
jgi:hypothetical protein